MKAVVLDGFGDVENFRLADIDKPAPKDDQVLVQIKAAAFNPIDYQMRQGRRESRLMNSPVMGREMAGVVVAVGEKVDYFRVGDEIMAASGSRGSNGTYAEFMALSPELISHKPKNITFEEAAAIPSAGLTALQSFKRMKVNESESVFIAGGAGGVGSVLIKILKSNGIERIVSTAGNEHSKNALLDLGLKNDQIINYKSENLLTEILSANGNNKFDFAADIVGGQISETAAEVLKVNGNYVDITFLGTRKTREVLFDKGCVILNISNYAYALKGDLAWYGRTLSELAQLIESGGITAPSINLVGDLSVETVQKAHALLESNQIFGKKLVMKVS